MKPPYDNIAIIEHLFFLLSHKKLLNSIVSTILYINLRFCLFKCNRDVCLSLIREAPLRVAATSTRHMLMRIKQSRYQRQGEIKAATSGVSR